MRMEANDPLASLLQPVLSPTAFEQTVERLATAIKLGFLAPGSRLPSERELAEQLLISRTTLRQALTALVQSGLLVTSRGRRGGTFVAEPLPLPPRPRRVLQEDELLGLLDHRLAIETGAMLRAVERATDEDIARLRALTDQMESTDKFEDYRQADVRFHIGIAEATHSSRLVGGMTEVHSELDEVVDLVPHPHEILSRANEQHRRLVSLLKKREATGAVRLLAKHLEGTEHFIIGMLPVAARGPQRAFDRAK